ncbi:VanZ family protein [Quisquiliibacterium transsilvanicum]|uniref:VanZ family protein n=1 Tax=Quisquiliibacterium transsilvanicum TaxID=1549638 RepID=A0A7W8HJ52_9BURK|nr:VanZ family protein [Quisquiliibacterium transsilvanicum]MBB5272153.1 VanZ family protein [Quisquiliibacterium transsilvanicum]
MPTAERPARAGLVAAVVVYMIGLAWLSLSRGGAPACGASWLMESGALSRADLVVNVVAYVPLGALIAAGGAPGGQVRRRILLAAATGALLSLAIETIQVCLPARTSAWSDLLANASGAAIGAIFPGVVLRAHRAVEAGGVPGLPAGSTAPQPLLALALLTLFFWIGERSLPWALTLDVDRLRANLAFLKPALAGMPTLDPWRLASHVAAWLVFGLAIRAGLQSWAPVLRITAIGVFTVLLLQLLLVVPSLSLEQLVGLAIAAVGWILLRLPAMSRCLPLALCAATLAWVTLYELRQGMGELATGFSWLPIFGAGNPLGALQLGLYFFAVALAFALARAWQSALRHRQRARQPGRQTPRGASLAVAATVAWIALLEVAQLWIPGRSPDVSPPLLVGLGWMIALAVQARVRAPVRATASRSGS